MFSPSTAPRWKRQTRMGRSEAVWGGKGRYDANAARARNSGSRPRLKSASPPDFTKTRLDIDIARLLEDFATPYRPFFTAPYRPLPPLTALFTALYRPLPPSTVIASETPVPRSPARRRARGPPPDR